MFHRLFCNYGMGPLEFDFCETFYCPQVHSREALQNVLVSELCYCRRDGSLRCWCKFHTSCYQYCCRRGNYCLSRIRVAACLRPLAYFCCKLERETFIWELSKTNMYCASHNYFYKALVNILDTINFHS